MENFEFGSSQHLDSLFLSLLSFSLPFPLSALTPRTLGAREHSLVLLHRCGALAAPAAARCRQASPLTPAPLECARSRMPLAAAPCPLTRAPRQALGDAPPSSPWRPNRPRRCLPRPLPRTAAAEPLTAAGHQCRAPMAPKPPPSHPLVALNGQNTPPVRTELKLAPSPLRPIPASTELQTTTTPPY